MSVRQQRAAGPVRARGTDRSAVRRAELLAIGRTLFADTSSDAVSMDDIARQAHAAKRPIHYCFRSKRGHYPAIVQDLVAELVAFAAGRAELHAVDRLRRTIDGHLRLAEHHKAPYRTIVSGGAGSDAEVHAVRDGARETIVAALADGAYGRTGIGPPDRTGLFSWVCGVEGTTLDRIGRPAPIRAAQGEVLVETLGGTLRPIEELDPSCPAPPPARRDG
ncbi:TetR/AcrR family transcriptional regulator [Streptomyces griseoluteus]|uniref:TetR/AcrR family transcriptional regulator n=1 Tax=Streptomyces griseoluteus TaxID=29306 RepID=UPI003658AFBB